MLEKLKTEKKVVGIKQLRRALNEHRALVVFLADDADPALTEPLAQLCRRAGIPVEQGMTMSRLGQACRIDVGCAAAAELKPR